MLSKVDDKTYIFGNYRITEEKGYWLLVPSTPQYGFKTWLTNDIRCDSREDAFRIANVFTGEELVGEGLRDVFKLWGVERILDYKESEGTDDVQK
jgi:hypothetical protein